MVKDIIRINTIRSKRCKGRLMSFSKQVSSPFFLALTVTLFLVTVAPALSPAYAGEMQQVSSVEDLWMDMRIGPPLIPLFNQAARSNDIARVEHPSQVGQLAEISAGRKMVIFQSVEEAAQLLPEMAAEIDIIGYNLEHGQTTPAGEKADPVGSIKEMRELADSYGLQLAFGPDHDFALSHGVEIAPFVDIFVLQVQRQQTRPAIVEEFVIPLVPQLRQANPDLEVSVQVRTEGDVQEIVALLDSLKEQLDGVSILTSPDTVDVAEELVSTLRPNAALLSQGGDQTTLYFLLGGAAIALLIGVLYFRRQRNSQSDQP